MPPTRRGIGGGGASRLPSSSATGNNKRQRTTTAAAAPRGTATASGLSAIASRALNYHGRQALMTLARREGKVGLLLRHPELGEQGAEEINKLAHAEGYSVEEGGIEALLEAIRRHTNVPHRKLRDFQRLIERSSFTVRPSWSTLLKTFNWLCSLQHGIVLLRPWVLALLSVPPPQGGGVFQVPSSLSMERQDWVCMDPIRYLSPLLIRYDSFDQGGLTSVQARQLDDIARTNGWWTNSEDRRMIFLVSHFSFDKYSECNSETLYTAEEVLATTGPGAQLRHLEHARNEGWLVALEQHHCSGKDEKNALRVVHGSIGPKTLICRIQDYRTELSIYSSIRRLQAQDPKSSIMVPPPSPAVFEGCDAAQTEAVKMALKSPLSLVTGPGGCGKTSRVARSAWRSSSAATGIAPTHVAKNRLAEELEIPISRGTIRTIQSSTWSFSSKSRLQTLIDEAVESCKEDFLIVVDEGSMVTSSDMDRILRIAVDNISDIRVVVLIIGDPNQLPPITCGAPFIDMFESKAIPTSTLQRVYRADSVLLAGFCLGLLDSFYSVKPENPKALQHQTDGKVTLTAIESDEHLLTVLEASLSECPHTQVITYTNKDCIRFSHMVRDARKTPHRPREGENFAEGDDVLFCHNSRWWRNGDAARIESRAEGQYERYIVSYTPADEASQYKDETGISDVTFDQDSKKNLATVSTSHIIPSTARTVHKCQGAGFDHVTYVLPVGIPYDKVKQLKSLNYTACSRARCRLRIIAPIRAFNDNNARKTFRRRTVLQELFASPLLPGVLEQEQRRISALLRVRNAYPEHRFEAWESGFGANTPKASCSRCAIEISFKGSFALLDGAIMCAECTYSSITKKNIAAEQEEDNR